MADQAEPTTPADAKRRRRIRGWRLWGLRLLMMILAPTVFLLLLELTLMAVGFGRPLDYMLAWTHDGKAYYHSNYQFGSRFFPDAIARAPERVIIEANPQQPTVRIVVVGGSAAFGDPDNRYGFCRVLEILLNQHSTGPRFEVINAAMTAVDSTVAHIVARDSLRIDPDVIVAYTGNNEIVGPFGPTALPDWIHRRAWLVDLQSAARDTHIGQLVTQSSGQGRAWRGMEAFLEFHIPLGDSRLTRGYQQYRENLENIAHLASTSPTRVLLCTVPTNLRACPPFGSQHDTALTKAQLQQFKRHWEEGRRLHKVGQYRQALEPYRLAQAIDPGYAELAYVTAQCMEQAGDFAEAKRLYERARDLDTMRFRADGRINQLVHEVVEASSTAGVSLLDLEQVIQQASHNTIPGGAMFVDHVHLTFRGNVRASLQAMAKLAAMLPEGTLTRSEVWDDPDAAEAMLRERLLFDDWAEMQILLTMYRRKQRPPFTGQLDHQLEIESLRQDIGKLERITQWIPAQAREQRYRHAVIKYPDDAFVLRAYVQLLLDQGRIDEASKACEAFVAEHPFNPHGRILFAVARAKAGDVEQGIEILTSPDQPFPFSATGAEMTLRRIAKQDTEATASETPPLP